MHCYNCLVYLLHTHMILCSGSMYGIIDFLQLYLDIKAGIHRHVLKMILSKVLYEYRPINTDLSFKDAIVRESVRAYVRIG